MDDINSLIPFSRLRQLSARGISRSTDSSSSSDNLLVYKGLIPIERYIAERNYFLLTQRYLAKLHHTPGIDDAFYEFTVLDLWSGKEIQIKMQRERKESLRFYPINDNFGCFIEYSYFSDPTFVSLVEYDFIDKIFRKIRTVELNISRNERIFLDEFDPFKFTLIYTTNDALHIQSFRLLNGTVNLKNTAQCPAIKFSIQHYFDRCIYWCFDAEIRVYDLTTSTSTRIKLNPPSDNSYRPCYYFNYAWIRDRVFIPVRFKSDDPVGIAWASAQSTRMQLLQFHINIEIKNIKYVGDGNLMLCAKKNGNRRIYKLPMRKPDLLRNLSWFAFKRLEYKIES